MKRKFKVLKPLVRDAGIYKISCTKTDKVYIGESLNISNRISNHFADLRKGEHHNIILQRIFSKYGEETFEVDIIKYSNFEETLTKEDKIRKLKEDEKYYQEQSNNPCISMDKNCYGWNTNASKEQKEANKKQLDSIRGKAMEAWKTPILIYNTESKESFIVDSLTEAEKYVEQKHIYRNIKDKVYLPYNNYVCFIPEEFDETKVLITNCKFNASIKSVYYLYDLINNKTYQFPSKVQASLFFGGKRNAKLYDRYSTFIDNNFITAIKIESEEQLWNTDFVFSRNKASIKTIKLSEYYNALKTFTNKTNFGKLLNVNKEVVSNMLAEKSITERIQEIVILVASRKKSI